MYGNRKVKQNSLRENDKHNNYNTQLIPLLKEIKLYE